MTIIESICLNVTVLLTSEEALGECKRQASQEQAAFMTTFAVYIEWIVLRTCRPLFTSEDYRVIATGIRKEIKSQHWFSNDLYQRIAPSAQQRLDTMTPGRNTGVLMPMVHAVEGANAVGHCIQHTTDANFAMYTIVAWKFMAEQIPK